MFEIPPLQYLLAATFILFVIGLVTFLIGALILILRSRDKDINIVTKQTSQIMQKSLAEDVAGLVGNASSLLNAMNDLAKTQNGIGVILVVVGVLLMFVACYFLWYITFRANA